ncbi:DUF5658 family protein [Neobacillus muris]|uniref:DUF5658 family protein n=1 Tax=Neobacillus muris TaxID=2941334 RepID=UPI00203C953F|nr:DUF5658 family protein [Neobacillus muris]
MKLGLFLLFSGMVDAALTHYGIISGVIEEGNPIMKLVIEKDWSYFYVIKVLLPIVLIVLITIHPITALIKRLMVSASILYFSVLFYHLTWILLYTFHM